MIGDKQVGEGAYLRGIRKRKEGTMNDKPKSPLMRVSEASKLMLCNPPTVYDKIARGVFPLGVVVHLGPRSIRFHRENLVRWLEAGGTIAVISSQREQPFNKEDIEAAVSSDVKPFWDN